MNYWLFLDDSREVKDVKWISLPKGDWVIARNYQEFCSIISSRHNSGDILSKVSFDHDLGDESYKEGHRCKWKDFNYNNLKGEKTGLDCARFLIDFCAEKDLDLPQVFIHTQNPVGRINIFVLLMSYESRVNSKNQGNQPTS